MELWVVVLVGGVLALLGLAALVLAARRRRRGPVAVPAAATPALTARGLRQALRASRDRLRAGMDAALGRGDGGVDAVLADVEEALVGADVGTRTAREIIARVRRQFEGRAERGEVRQLLRRELETMLAAPDAGEPSGRPWVVLVTGVNGVGKTTTIGKLAARHAAAGRRVLLVAADTFRAAAIDQLAVWAERTGAELVRQGSGANPAAVAFDGMKAALARDVDVVLIDTAGRLHTRGNLMEELRKVRRVIAREVPGAPHETLLVLDATTGQNAVAQAKTFMEAVDVSGLILTKLDGTARGGVVFAVRHELGLPVRYIGVGEGVDDLRPFDAQQFVDALLGDDPRGNGEAGFP